MIGAGSSGTLYVWSCVQGLLLGQFKAHSKAVNRMKVIGGAVLCCSDDGLLQMIHLGDIIQQSQQGDVKEEDKSALLRVFSGHLGAVTDFCLSQGEQLLFSIGQDKNMIVWDVQSARKKGNVVLTAHPNALLLSPLEDTAYVACSDKLIHLHPLVDSTVSCLYSLDTGVTDKKEAALVTSLAGHTGAVTHLSMLLQYNQLVSGSVNGEVIIWLPDHSIKRKITLQPSKPLSNLLVV